MLIFQFIYFEIIFLNFWRFCFLLNIIRLCNFISWYNRILTNKVHTFNRRLYSQSLSGIYNFNVSCIKLIKVNFIFSIEFIKIVSIFFKTIIQTIDSFIRSVINSLVNACHYIYWQYNTIKQVVKAIRITIFRGNCIFINIIFIFLFKKCVNTGL